MKYQSDRGAVMKSYHSSLLTTKTENPCVQHPVSISLRSFFAPPSQILFFLSCIPGIGMLILWSLVDIDYGAGMIMSLLTFVAWCIPIMFVLMLDFNKKENPNKGD